MKSIIEKVEELPDCSVFFNLLKKTGIELDENKSYTLFLPNNKACECVEEGLPEEVLDIVKYHFLEEEVRALDLVPYKLRKTLHGKDVCLEAIKIQVNASHILKADIKCSNGTIHIIDRILIPKEASCEPTTSYYADK
ncbi:MAG: hypothetical protein GTO02_01505 [Candidatus Dadabacteria bacterium]|nr:hypothetical protein [Candidatus Dadabacteria bacterium]